MGTVCTAARQYIKLMTGSETCITKSFRISQRIGGPADGKQKSCQGTVVCPQIFPAPLQVHRYAVLNAERFCGTCFTSGH